MNRRKDWEAAFWLALGCLVVIAAIQYKLPDELELQQRQYCEMHALWLDSGGELGWPDFHETFAARCNRDGSVKEAP